MLEASASKYAAVVHLMAPVDSDDEDGHSGEYVGLHAMRADGQYPPDDAVLNRDNTYLANKFIEDATFDSFYSQDEVRQRHKLRANNGKASSKPHLFAKDIWFKKRVCVECKCIGHTAGSERCRSNKRKSFNNKEQRLMMAQVKKTLQKRDGLARSGNLRSPRGMARAPFPVARTTAWWRQSWIKEMTVIPGCY